MPYENLLRNGDFEADWGEEGSHRCLVFPEDGAPYESDIGNIFVPPGWKAWFRHDPGTWDQPEVRDAHRSGDPRRAAPLFELVLARMPTRLPALRGLALIRRRQSRPAEAAALLQPHSARLEHHALDRCAGAALSLYGDVEGIALRPELLQGVGHGDGRAAADCQDGDGDDDSGSDGDRGRYLDRFAVHDGSPSLPTVASGGGRFAL